MQTESAHPLVPRLPLEGCRGRRLLHLARCTLKVSRGRTNGNTLSPPSTRDKPQSWTHKTPNRMLQCRQLRALLRDDLGPGLQQICNGFARTSHTDLQQRCPDATRRFLQRNDATILTAESTSSGIRACANAIPTQIQEWAKVFRGHARRATCRSASRTLQILQQQRLIQLERDLRLSC